MHHLESPAFRIVDPAQRGEIALDEPRKRRLALGGLLASHLEPSRLEEGGDQIVLADQQQDVQAEEATFLV